MKVTRNSNLRPIATLACGEVFQRGDKYFMVVQRECNMPKDRLHPVVNLETGIVRYLEGHDMVEPLPNITLHV